jgi:hypothetical protein
VPVRTKVKLAAHRLGRLQTDSAKLARLPQQQLLTRPQQIEMSATIGGTYASTLDTTRCTCSVLHVSKILDLTGAARPEFPHVDSAEPVVRVVYDAVNRVSVSPRAETQASCS